MQPIFLIGFMGSGKTTLARAFSEYSGLQFIDLDIYIERRFRRTVREIFATDGEERFRDLERRMLEEVGEFQDVVVACGGGTPCFGNNMDFMNTHGTTVHLVASEERLLDRLIKGRHKRPLLAGMDSDAILNTIRTRYAERIPFYSRAHLTFDTDRLETREEIDDTVGRFASLLGIGAVSTNNISGL